MTKEQRETIVKMWNVCTIAEIAAAIGLPPRRISIEGHRIGRELKRIDPSLLWLDHRTCRQASSVDYEALAALAREAAE